MKSTKKILLLFLCMLAVTFAFASCGECKEDEHKWGEYVTKTAATCYSEGLAERVCSECEKTDTKTIAKIAHTFGEYVSCGDATCTADGTKTATCTVEGCTATDTVADEGSKTSHTFTTYTSNGDATCTADGTKTAKCDNCDATDTVADPGTRKAHSFTNYVSNGDATCCADGTKTAKCDNCDTTDTQPDADSKVAHSFTTYTSNGDATCTKDGTKTAKCDNCPATDTVADVGSKVAHSFTNYVSNGDATCYADGTKTAKCDNCPATDTVTDAGTKRTHSFTTYVPDNNAKCGVNGTETAKCDHAGCEETDVREIANSALKHVFDTYVADGNATCERDGTKTASCKWGCGETNTITDTNSKTGHSFTNYVYNENAKCGVDGTETAKCDNCDKTHTRDKEGTALEHLYTSYKSNGDATCCADGTETAYCDRVGCDAKDTRPVLNSALGHKFENYVSCGDATCTEDGHKTAKCSNAGCNETDTVVDVDSKLGHRYENYVSNHDEKCGVDGTKTAYCANGCGESDTVANVGSALEHSFTNYKSDNNATCEEDGTKTAYCQNGCGTPNTIADVDSKLGHSYKNYVSNHDATCTEDGTETAYCANGCGTSSTITDVDSKLGHKHVNYVYNNDATCQIDGTKTAQCENGCGTPDTVVAEGTKLDSCSFTNYVSNGDATYENDGTKTAYCDYGCGNYHTVTDEGSKLAHHYGEYVYNNDATCYADGTETATCIDDGCGATHTRVKTGTKRTHSFTNYQYNNDAKCGVDGTKTAVCGHEGCGATDTVTDEGTALTHRFENYTSDGNATCEIDGTKTAFCENGCGAFDRVTDKDSRLGHAFGEYTYNNDAKCGIDGTKTAKCQNDGCNKTDTQSAEGTALEHKFENYTSDGNATCEADGTKTAFCENGCGAFDRVADVDSKLGHDFGEYVYNNDAKCEKDGTKTATCKRCGRKDTVTAEGTALTHVFTTYVDDNNASCSEEGTKTALCDLGCGAKHSIVIPNSQLPHNFGGYVSNGDATCAADGTKTGYCQNAGCKVSTTVTDVGSKIPHKFTNYISNGDATCLADGTKTAKCDYAGCNETDTKTDVGSKKNHTYTNYVSNGDATCTKDGTATAVCDTEGCTATHTRDDEGSKLGHAWDKASVTCTDGRECTRTGCDAQEAALGHSYMLVDEQALTCEHDHVKYYDCSTCHDTYDEIVAKATGHNPVEWVKVGETAGSKNCEFIIAYQSECSNEHCHLSTLVKNETVIRHTYTTARKNDATCQVPGIDVDTCSVCGHEVEHTYENPDAHVWGEGVANGNVITYTCNVPGCTETKTEIKTTENNATASTGDLADKGLAFGNDTSVKLDGDTLAGLKGDGEDVDVTIGADAIDKNTLEGKVDSDTLAQIKGDTVYDFSMLIGNTPIRSFDGYVTIRVPYELDEGEDVNSIAVWYINDAGELEPIQAVYDNGYAVFTTNHFSIYTVTRLTPAERCALYGHSYHEVVVKESCTSDGYTLKICQRCGKSEKVDIVFATGHDLDVVVVDPTCTEYGSRTSTCKTCGYTHVETIGSTGHSWETVEEVAATCQAAGYKIHECENCDATYKTVIAQKNHAYVDTVVAVGCTTEGYTIRVCSYCNNTVETGRIAPLGHNYKANVVAPTCTEEGYTNNYCARCNDSYKSDIVPPAHTWDIEAPTCGKGQSCVVCNKGGLPATGAHNLVDGICSVCGVGCAHDYVTVVLAPTCTDGGYTTKTCKICAVVKTSDYVGALGHTEGIKCDRCGEKTTDDDFYTSMLESLLNEGYTILINKVMVDEDTYLEAGELTLSRDDNGKLVGRAFFRLRLYGAGDIVLLDGWMKAVIENDVVYVEGNNVGGIFGTINRNIHVTMPLGELLKFISGDTEMPTIPVSDVYGFIIDVILPFVKNFASGGSEVANEIAEVLVNLIADVKVVNGEYEFTISKTKIKALNERLAKESIGEFIDKEFGEGAYDAIIETVEAFFNLTLGEIIDYAADNDADVIELIADVDELLALILGEDANLSELLGFEYDEEAGKSGLQVMIESEETRSMVIKDIIAQVISSMNQNNSPDVPGVDTDGHGCYDKDGDMCCDECGRPIGGYIETPVVPMPDGHSCYDKDGDKYCDECGRIIGGYNGGEEYPVVHVCTDKDGDMCCDECGEKINGNVTYVPEIKGYEAVYVDYTEDEKAEGEADGEADSEMSEADEMVDFILEMLEELREATVYQLFEIDDEEIDGVIDAVNDNIDLICDNLNFSIVADKDGKVQSVALGFAGQIDVAIVADYVSGVDYSSVVDNVVKETGFDPADEYLKGGYEEKYDNSTTAYTYEIIKDENGNIVSIIEIHTNVNSWEDNWYDYDENFNIRKVTRRYVYEYRYTTTLDMTSGMAVMSMDDCGNWNYYSIAAPGMHKSERVRNVIETYVDGVLADVEEIEDGEFEKESYYSTESIELFYNPTTGEIAYGIDTYHDLVADEASSKPAIGCTGLGENHYFCTRCGEVQVEYYTNGHHFESEYSLVEGGKSCEDGVICKTVCVDCGYVAGSYTEYGHYQRYEEIDVRGYGACEHHRVGIHTCTCGEYFDISASDYSKCKECGFEVITDGDETPTGNPCEYKRQYVIIVKVGDTTVTTIEGESVYVQHNTHNFVTLLPGSESCEDGVLVEWKCVDCGYSDKGHVTYHHEDGYTVIADLSEYGSVCGVQAVSYGCACGESGKSESIQFIGKCEFEVTTEYHYDWSDYLERRVCAVTSPACGFEVYVHAYRETDGCTTSYHRDIYTMKGDEKVYISKEIYRVDTHHNMQLVEGESTMTPTNIPCVYLVEGRQVCMNGCGHSEVVAEYQISHEHKNGYEGSYDREDTRDEYGNGYVRWNYCENCGCGTTEYYENNRRVSRTEKSYYKMMYSGGYSGIQVNTQTSEYAWYQGVDGEYYEWEAYDYSEYIGYRGNGTPILEQINNQWSERRYEYGFDNGECLRTVYSSGTYEPNNKETDSVCYWHRTNNETVIQPTCTQDGYRNYNCAMCGNAGGEKIEPRCHGTWDWNDAIGMYVCMDCGLINANGGSGNIVLEDLSDTDGDDDSYIVGYYYRGEFAYGDKYGEKIEILQSITLILADGMEIFVDGIKIEPWGERMYKFSKSEVVAAAARLGYDETMYDIRISFVPVGWETDLDYAITFEVMSATEECEHFYGNWYGRRENCVWCGEKYVCLHTNYYERNTVPSNCTEEGYVECFCYDCGSDFTRPIEVNPDAHVYIYGEDSGCIYCGFVVDCKHEKGGWWQSSKGATCLTDGYTQYGCESCGYSYRHIEKASRNYCQYWDNPDFCSVCGLEYVCMHNYGSEWVSYQPSTCITQGYDEYRCLNCGENFRNYYDIQPDHHSWNDNQCEWCGKVCEHVNSYYTGDGWEGNCTDVGYDQHYCNDCYQYYNVYKDAPLGHEFNEEGYCIRCGLTEEQTKCEHDWVLEKASDATCTNVPFEYYVCSRCGHYKHEYPGEHRILPHNYVDDICTECNARRVYYFEYTLKDEVGETRYELSFHSNECVRWVIYVNGELQEASFDCSYYRNDSGLIIINDYADYQFVICDDGRTLTLYTEGEGGEEGGETPDTHICYDDDLNGYCDKCGKVIGGLVNPDVCTHPNSEQIDVVYGTCIKGGYIKYWCHVCGNSYTVDTEPDYDAHTLDINKNVCIYCSLEFPGCDHENKTVNRIEDATCYNDGFVLYECYDCGLMLREIRPAGAGTHRFDNGVCIICKHKCAHENSNTNGEYFEGSCTELGYIGYNCAICSYNYLVYTDYLPHNFGEDGACTGCGITEEQL